MSSIAIFLSIVAALAIGAISPGPSFVLVSRIAVSRSRRAGFAAALGMAVGGVTFAALALLGLNALLMQVSWLYLLLKMAGGLYLIYLGIRIWRGAQTAAGDRSRQIRLPRRRNRPQFLVWTGHTTEQSEDRHRLWQHFRGAVARFARCLAYGRVAACGLCG